LIEGLREGIKKLFKSSECQRIIKYQSRKINFKDLGPQLPIANFSLGEINISKENLRSTTEIAKTLDDFQYFLCKTMETQCKKGDSNYQRLFAVRVDTINLITRFRLALSACEKDPEKNQRHIDEVLYDMTKLQRSSSLSHYYWLQRKEELQKISKEKSGEGILRAAPTIGEEPNLIPDDTQLSVINRVSGVTTDDINQLYDEIIKD